MKMGHTLSKKRRKGRSTLPTVPPPPRSAPREEKCYEKCYDPNDSTLTFVDGDDDMDFECDEYKTPRALMSCGHSVTPMSLTKWCRRILDQGEYTFVCGQTDCDAEWPFEEVCKMALLTSEELDYFETKMFFNSTGCFDVKSCPGCRSAVMRSDCSNLSVDCSVCSAEKKQPYVFCWQCLRKWKGPSPRSDRCGNDGCVDRSLETLRNCPVMKFKDVKGVKGCPSIRACPNCGFLLGHDRTGCKEMFCTRCKLKFCFVCLKDSDDCQKKTKPYAPCSSGVAPRQTLLPVWDGGQH